MISYSKSTIGIIDFILFISPGPSKPNRCGHPLYGFLHLRTFAGILSYAAKWTMRIHVGHMNSGAFLSRRNMNGGKQCSFDAGSGLDVQFLCGAGLAATKEYLAKSGTSSASAVLKYLNECEQTGEFTDWTPQKTITYYRRYYRLE